jgi:uncharacterized membrane protein
LNVHGVSGNLRSIYAMLVAVLMFFAMMDTCMKLLSAIIPAMQVAALRSLSSLPLVCAYVAWRGGAPFDPGGALAAAPVARRDRHRHAVAVRLRRADLVAGRSVFDLLHRPDPDHGAVRVRAEGARRTRALDRDRGRHGRRAGGAAADRGGLAHPGGLAVLAAAVCYAVSAVNGRILARTDRSEHMVFWLMLLMAIGAGALAAPAWVSVQAQHLPLLGALAVSGFFAQLAITEAFSHGEASVVAPFEYTALACGVAIDWLLWKTLPDEYTLLGAAIIIGSGLYLIRHETVHAEAEHP